LEFTVAILQNEGYGAEVIIRDDKEVKVADGLMLTISSSYGDYNKIFEVDCEKRKVLGLHSENEGDIRGRFAGFFITNLI